MRALSLYCFAVTAFLFHFSLLAAEPKTDGADCINQVAQRLGIDSLTETDPVLLNDILKSEMFLGDFPPFASTVAPFLEVATPLGPFIERVKAGTLSGHPTVVQFLCSALEAGLLIDATAEHARIKRILHHTFLLELLVQRMVDDFGFMRAVKQHYLEKRRQAGIRSSFLGSAIDVFRSTGGDLFETAKMLTMDGTFDQYIRFRDKVDLTQRDLRAKRRGLLTNIMEATTVDATRRFLPNSKTGLVLAALPVKEVAVEGPKGEIKQRFAEGWSALYQTWNLAFITGNLTELDLLYPKLLLPLLVNAAPEDYLYRRGVTLWVSANIVLLHKVLKTDRKPLGPFPAAAKLWGDINLNYAREVFDRSAGRCARLLLPM